MPQKTARLTLAPLYAHNLRGQRWYVLSSSYCPFIRLSTLADFYPPIQLTEFV